MMRESQVARKSSKGKILIVLLAIVIILFAFFFFANRHLFRVRNWAVNISGSGMYLQEEIINASGIASGAELFGFDRAAAQNNIKRELPYVSSVSITRLPPSTLRIDIYTDTAAFGILLGEEYYIISENFRVVEKIRMDGNSLEYIKPLGIVNLITNNVVRSFVGERIEFNDDDVVSFLEEFLKLRRGHESAEMITSIDVRDKFNVVMDYGGLYTVQFGVFENIYRKALNSFDVIKVLDERSLRGTIDVSNKENAIFMP